MPITVYLEKTRFKKQLDIAKAVHRYKNHCIIQLPARFGKTITSMLILGMKQIENYYISPNEVLSKQAYNEYLIDYIYDNNRICFKEQTNIKFKTKHDLLTYGITINPLKDYVFIIDEIHLYTGEQGLLAINSLRKLPNVRIVGMTGQISLEDCNILGITKAYTMRNEEAVDNKYIAPSNEFAVPLEFDPQEQVKYKEYTDMIRENLKFFEPYKDKFVELKGNLITLAVGCAKGYSINKKYQKPAVFCKAISEYAGWKHNLDLESDYWRSIHVHYHPTEIHRKAKILMKAIELRNVLMAHNSKKSTSCD